MDSPSAKCASTSILMQSGKAQHSRRLPFTFIVNDAIEDIIVNNHLGLKFQGSQPAIMVFDSVAYRDELLSLPNCLGDPNFIETAGWVREDTGNVLVSRTSSENLVAIVTGKVSPFRLQCGPAGNFRAESKVQSDFSKAKFQLTLDPPMNP
jgi:hypothetical protein